MANILRDLPSFIRSIDVPQVEGEHIDEWFKRVRAYRDAEGGKPLWSGRGGVPAIGAFVDIAGPKNEVATVLGYTVSDSWLMLWCKRHSDGKEGDLAGTELRYGEKF